VNLTEYQLTVLTSFGLVGTSLRCSVVSWRLRLSRLSTGLHFTIPAGTNERHALIPLDSPIRKLTKISIPKPVRNVAQASQTIGSAASGQEPSAELSSASDTLR
jgi:hypothetical protein